jgi:hypothetical protein
MSGNTKPDCPVHTTAPRDARHPRVRRVAPVSWLKPSIVLVAVVAVFSAGVVANAFFGWSGEIHHIVGGICAVLLILRPPLGYTGAVLFVVYEIVEWLMIGDTPDKDILEFCIGFFLVCIGYLAEEVAEWLRKKLRS